MRQRSGGPIGWRARYLLGVAGLEAPALLLLVGAGALAIGIGLLFTRGADEPAELVAAEIVRFGASADDDGNAPLVLVKTPDGRVRQLHAHRSLLMGCKVGGTIGLVRRGARLSVAETGCSSRE